MLRTANKGASKTQLMYGAYLSYAQAKEYIGLALGRGLLTYDESDRLYKLTQKGLQVLMAADQMEKLLTPEPEVQQP